MSGWNGVELGGSRGVASGGVGEKSAKKFYLWTKKPKISTGQKNPKISPNGTKSQNFPLKGEKKPKISHTGAKKTKIFP
jgi:hypothetical protein